MKFGVSGSVMSSSDKPAIARYEGVAKGTPYYVAVSMGRRSLSVSVSGVCSSGGCRHLLSFFLDAYVNISSVAGTVTTTSTDQQTAVSSNANPLQSIGNVRKRYFQRRCEGGTGNRCAGHPRRPLCLTEAPVQAGVPA
jgi:hypothetical protein